MSDEIPSPGRSIHMSEGGFAEMCGVINEQQATIDQLTAELTEAKGVIHTVMGIAQSRLEQLTAAREESERLRAIAEEAYKEGWYTDNGGCTGSTETNTANCELAYYTSKTCKALAAREVTDE